MVLDNHHLKIWYSAAMKDPWCHRRCSWVHVFWWPFGDTSPGTYTNHQQQCCRVEGGSGMPPSEQP